MSSNGADESIVKMVVTACFGAIAVLSSWLAWVGKKVFSASERLQKENDELRDEIAGLREKVASYHTIEKPKKDED